MNLANKITISRIILTFVFIFLLSFPFPNNWHLWTKAASLVVFLLAALSDLLDGKIAQKWNMVTDFGKLMDPIADKMLVLSAFLVFVQMGLIAGWMVVIIVARELLITSLRLFALNKGKVLSAAKSGKHKTFSQMLLIIIILSFIVFKEFCKVYASWNPYWEKGFIWAVNIVMWFVVILTLWSGLSYLWKNRKVIANI
ncbi:MAG: CDP-diacylglycerol--glycerol-3-phosphate 3-phosphatidyltransferase [Candidatus Omnitrophica bacterium]|nr:CDP-diacylglycerol--glycerol-3-phosphate 3-phosphatidyltransferase [Candidatus Omnitrophota bacterium]